MNPHQQPTPADPPEMEAQPVTPRRRDSLGYHEISLADDVRKLSFTNRLPFVNRDSQCRQLFQYLNAAEANYRRAAQRITVPSIVGLSGIGKSTFARQAALRNVDAAVGEATKARLKYIRSHHALVRLDLAVVGDRSDAGFLKALQDECCKYELGDHDFGDDSHGLAAGLKRISASFPEPSDGESRALLINLDETNAGLRISGVGPFSSFLQRLVSATKRAYSETNGQTAVFITLPGTHAQDLASATLASECINSAEISLPLLCYDHVRLIIQHLLPDDWKLRDEHRLNEALRWCSGVPRYLEFLLNGLAQGCESMEVFVNVLGTRDGDDGAADPRWDAPAREKLVIQAMDRMMTVSSGLPQLSDDTWVVSAALYLIFTDFERNPCSRETTVTPRVTISELESRGLVYFNADERLASVPLVVLKNMVNSRMMGNHPLSHIRWLFDPALDISPDEHELLTIVALASRLHYVRLFAEDATLGEFLPPLMNVAQDRRSKKARAINRAVDRLANTSVAGSKGKLLPHLTRSESQITHKQVETQWSNSIRGARTVGFLNARGAPFADSMLWTADWAIFVQDKHNVVARGAAERGRRPDGVQHATLSNEWAKVFNDTEKSRMKSRPLPRKCKTQLFVLCTDEVYDGDHDSIFRVPSPWWKRVMPMDPSVMLVLHQDNQKHLFGMLYELKRRRIHASRADSLPPDSGR